MSQIWTVGEIVPGSTAPATDITKLTDALASLKSNFIGTSLPVTNLVAGMFAIDTADDLYVRNSANDGWVLIGNIEAVRLGAAALAGSATQVFSVAAATAAAHAVRADGVMGKNKIINGGMQIAQRGTSGNYTNAWAYNSIDRMAFLQGGGSSVATVTQVGYNSNGFGYIAKLNRTAGSALTGGLYIGQTLESRDSVNMQGKTFTFSFYAYAGANFSASGNLIAITVTSGTGTDQAISAIGTWTGAAFPINTTTAITSALTRYTFTGTFGGGINQIGFYINYTPTGTAGADDSLYITGIQLEEGPVATPFEYRHYGTELALCQRYGRWNTTGSGWSSSTTNVVVSFNFPAMRISPTPTLISGTNMLEDATVAARTVSTLSTVNSSNPEGMTINLTCGATTASKHHLIYSGNFIWLDAEL